MSRHGRYRHLNANLLPGTVSDPQTGAHPFIDVEAYVETARLAESAGFDAVFLSDALAVQPNPRNGWNVALDPFTILGALTRETAHIGLVATASTTYSAPYALARAVLSIDHMSHGRAGWNVITTMDPAASRNFGVSAHPAGDERYRRATEFTTVVRALWASWQEDLARQPRSASGVARSGPEPTRQIPAPTSRTIPLAMQTDLRWPGSIRSPRSRTVQQRCCR